jgi:hypothetical protein
MSNQNRFQVPAEHEEPDEQHLQDEEAPDQVIQDAQLTKLGEEGWDDDLDISDGEDSGDNDVIEDGNRRQKVSTGPRDAHTSNMTFPFPPVSTRQFFPGRGRGEGMVVQPETTIGLLPTITETTETKKEDAVGEATEDKDITRILTS